MVVLLLLGLAARIWLCDVATRHGYPWDTYDNIGMGLTSAQQGLLKIYSVGFDDLAEVPGFVHVSGEREPLRPPRRAIILPNYPPLCITLFWAQVKLLGTVQPRVEGNTFVSRLVMASVPILFELATALGVMLLAGALFDHRAGLLAGAVTWMFPPIAMNSTLWGQVDSFFLAPAVFLVLCLVRRSWMGAGFFLALAALLKPQGVLLAPILLFAAVVLEDEGHRATVAGALRRLARSLCAALATIVVFTAPWVLADGLAWVERVYVASFVEAFPITTLKAFNFWYLDALRLDARSFALDSQATIAGVSKDALGRLLLLGAMLLFARQGLRRYNRRPLGIVVFAALWLWSVFMLPTRVHERFIIYCMPAVIVLAGGVRRYWPALAGLLVIGTAEHTWNIWLHGPQAGALLDRRTAELTLNRATRSWELSAARLPAAARPPRPTMEDVIRVVRGRLPEYLAIRARTRPWEYALTIASILAYGWAIGVSFIPPPAVSAAAGRRRRDRRRGG